MADADVDENADSPFEFIAETVNVYVPPFVSPGIVIGDDVAVKVSPEGETLTMNPVIAAPFALAPENVTIALRSPAIAVTVVGAKGLPEGVTGVDDVEGEVPTELTATALKLYEVPFVRPEITQEVVG